MAAKVSSPNRSTIYLTKGVTTQVQTSPKSRPFSVALKTVPRTTGRIPLRAFVTEIIRKNENGKDEWYIVDLRSWILLKIATHPPTLIDVVRSITTFLATRFDRFDRFESFRERLKQLWHLFREIVLLVGIAL
ncbi:hypothetical protein Q31b_06200 [Novipirellula aureliae]|uniref:Uncharacterized protein n=1 Tax=Novipirellula aureliae TaxID=2527966 RepID=A0A5C6E9D5_9BACT|nr:hypothetical protein Q31b_06200 [Novipirellula aureliae]